MYLFSTRPNSQSMVAQNNHTVDIQSRPLFTQRISSHKVGGLSVDWKRSVTVITSNQGLIDC